MDDKKVDYNKLSPQVKMRLLEIEKNSPAFKQLQAMQDTASMVQDIHGILSDSTKDLDKKFNEIGTLLVDAREQLVSLNKKETPESPDYSEPIVKALKSVESAVSKIELNPQFKPTFTPNIKVDAPAVNVTPPSVDLKGVEKAVKEIPKAFEKAIKLIPMPEKSDNSDLLQVWQGISEQLESIDTATRMKPLPGSMAISNLSTTPLISGFSTSAKQDTQTISLADLDNKLTFLLDRLDYGMITDIAKRLKVVPEQATAANLLATVSIAATQTLGTVSTVASVTNTVRQGDLQMQRVNEAMLDTAFINGITNNIAIT